ncbi:hypothetical protein AB4Z54_72075, partial [Streptomyces sp. MCAF7]
LQQIVRRGSTNSVRYRRAMILPASAGGNTVPVIARLRKAAVAAPASAVAVHELLDAALGPRAQPAAQSRPAGSG